MRGSRRRPLFNLKVVFGSPMPSQFMLIAFLRLTILATAYLIPLYLGSVRGFRALEVGDTLVWIAAPQLVLCPLAALMLRRSDARLVASIGFIFISVACLMVAYNLTPHLGVVPISSLVVPASRRAKLCAVGRRVLRRSSLEAPGCADVRRGAADGASHGRRDRHGVRVHSRPGARAGRLELDRTARAGGRSSGYSAGEGVWGGDHESPRSRSAPCPAASW